MTCSGTLSAFLVAVNAGDIDGLSGLFSEEAVIDDWGLKYCGKAEVRKWCDRELISARARMAVSAIKKQGCIETMFVNVGGHGFLGPCRFTFTLSGERIVNLRITPQ